MNFIIRESVVTTNKIYAFIKLIYVYGYVPAPKI